MKAIPELKTSTTSGGIQWMFRSQAVADVDLANALVDGCCHSLYRRIWLSLGDESLARTTAAHTIIQAVRQRHKFHGDQPIDDWLDRLAEKWISSRPEEWPGNRKAVRSLPSPEEDVLLPHLDLIRAEVLAQLESRQDPVDLRLPAHWKPWASLGVSILFLISMALFLPIYASQPATTPTAVLILATPASSDLVNGSAAVPQTPSFTYDYYVRRGDTLDSIAQKAGITPKDIDNLNYIDPNQSLEAGRGLKIPVYQKSWRLDRMVFGKPSLLTMRSSEAEIFNAITYSGASWDSVWAVTYRLTYGPAGYSGPLLNKELEQDWIQAQPFFATRASGNHTYSLLRYYGDHYQVAALGNMSSLLSQPNPSFPIDNPGLPVITHLMIDNRWSVQKVGLETVAGQECLVTDWSDNVDGLSYRIWIDTRTGLALAWQQFAGQDFKTVSAEMVTLKLQYNSPLPDNIFDPNQRTALFEQLNAQEIQFEDLPVLRYALSPSTIPDRQVPTPPGFDIRKQPVTMHWSQTPGTENSSTRVDLFSGQYHLGQLDFSVGEKPGAFEDCDRSADGQYLAFSTQSPFVNLFWIDLLQPGKIHTVYKEVYEASAFAFSPSGARLAFYACPRNQNGEGCAIRLLDMHTGRITHLMSIDFPPYFLAWSPDGRQLAAARTIPGNSYDLDLVVLEAASGKVIYTGWYDRDTRTASPGSPTNNWVGAFPPPLGNQRDCQASQVGK